MRRVLITGASSGIGAATARQLDRRGDRLALLARSETGLAKVASDLGGAPVILPADVGDRDALEAAVGRAGGELGGPDAVVVGAAATAFGPFAEISAEDFDRTLRTALIGAVDTIRATIPAIEESGGTIVVIGSIAGRVPMPLMSPYVTAKHGLRGLVRSLRTELRAADSPASICLVDPGPVDTPFWQHVRSFDGLLPPRLLGAYRAEDVATEVVRRIDRSGGDSSVGAAMEAWRIADLLLPAVTERIIGAAGALALKPGREPSNGDALHSAAGDGETEGDLHGRHSVLVTARSALGRVGISL